MQNRDKINTEQLSADYLEDGMSLIKLAKKYLCGRPKITKILMESRNILVAEKLKASINKNKNKISIDQLVSLYLSDEKYSVQDIADLLSFDRSAVYRRLKNTKDIIVLEKLKNNNTRNSLTEKNIRFDIELLCKEYLEEGMTLTKLSQSYGCSNSPIIDRLNNSGNNDVLLKLKRLNVELDEKEIICDYLKNGENMNSLSEKYKCSPNTISRTLKKANNIKVNEKIKDTIEKLTERNYSEIYLENNLIKVIANNTKNVYTFDNNELISEMLHKYSWYENPNGHLATGINNESTFVYWLIIGRPDEGFVVDHKNRIPYDNRKENLRFATPNENRINSKINKNNATGFKGVCVDKRTGLYRAYIHNNYKSIELGRYPTVEEAYIVRAKKEIEMYGEFAQIHDDFKYLIEEGKSFD